MKQLFYLLLLIGHFCNAQDSTKVKKLIEQALIYEEKGDIENAIKTHKNIFEINSDSYQSANSIAGLYGLKQNFPDEIIWAQKAIKLNKIFYGYINSMDMLVR